MLVGIPSSLILFVKNRGWGKGFLLNSQTSVTRDQKLLVGDPLVRNKISGNPVKNHGKKPQRNSP